MSEVVSPVQPTLKIALGIEYDGSRYYGWQRQQEVAACSNGAGVEQGGGCAD